jgi:Zn-dependent protease with chaperone function
MSLFRRAVPFAVMLALVANSLPLRALAISTQDQIRAGQAEDEEITRSQVVETDPLINAYVRSIANNLWLQVARKDLPYNIKVIKASDVNAFGTEGGFIYVDEGIVDFVQSDDELAGVIGHETGHIERNHVVTLNTKAQILNVLLGIASIFSPFIYDFGGLLGATVMAKMSREAELEADRTGLQLMARAGYDPDAMMTLMSHMSVLADEHSDLVDKYLEDHPDPQARVAHLAGYPELDPTKVTEQQLLVQAISDEERARYSYAALKLQKILAADPHNTAALLKLAQAQLALGQTSKSGQTLAEAAQAGSTEARALALVREASLREIEAHRDALLRLDPDFSRLSREVAGARQTQSDAAQELETRRDQARDQLQAVEARLRDISYEIPDLGNIQIRANSRLAAVVSNLEAMARAVNSGTDDATQVISGVGSLEPNKRSGLLRDGQEILNDMAAPLAMNPVPDESIAIFPSYSRMLDEVSRADGDALRAIDAARASLTQMDEGIGDLDGLLRSLDESYMSFGDLAVPDYNGLVPMMSRVMNEFDAAATSASQADQLYNMARARQLSVRITLLGVGDSSQRYATLQYALQQRFGLDGIAYRAMLHAGATPGEVVSATILAADCDDGLSCPDDHTPQAIIDTSARTKTPVIDLADEYGMHAWPMEIFMGLMYLDYTDDPTKELTEGGSSSGSAGI